MKLIRRWNPEASPFIKNPNGPKNFRLVALVKDDVHTHYVCFYDSWTGKIYVESLRAKHSGTWDYTDFWQVADDKEWWGVINFLSTDGVEVIQMVESKFEKGMTEMEFHKNLSKVPKVPYGVDANGLQVLTPDVDRRILISPSAL